MRLRGNRLERAKQVAKKKQAISPKKAEPAKVPGKVGSSSILVSSLTEGENRKTGDMSEANILPRC